ncbi:hypothetical protein DFS34DRAFT_245570 [Phlyctochytrium arcticum]|nr:hypothetical protein DFS34DRAFT_245570 [Phlyctochytrium arcticum]
MPGSQYKQQGMPSQGGAAKKAMTAEEFERLLGNENTTTRITLSSERHYASEDDLSDVSVENYGAGNRKSSSQMASRNTSQNGRQNQSSQHQHQQQQQQHQGMPQQLSPQSTNGFPGAFPSRTHPPIRSNSQTQPQQRSENADLEHDAARRKETQSLADFLRNTGPESPQPVRSGSAGSLDKKKEKKKKTGFFGFGRKLSKKESSKEPVEPEEQQQTKHVQLQVPYDPFRDGAPSQQPTVTEQQQQQQQQQQHNNNSSNSSSINICKPMELPADNLMTSRGKCHRKISSSLGPLHRIPTTHNITNTRSIPMTTCCLMTRTVMWTMTRMIGMSVNTATSMMIMTTWMTRL